jgi:hypothetical protein
MRNKCDAYVISLLSLPSTADLRTADSYPFVGGELRLITVGPPAFKEAAVPTPGLWRERQDTFDFEDTAFDRGRHASAEDGLPSKRWNYAYLRAYERRLYQRPRGLTH